MITQKLTDEFRKIFKEEYGIEYTDKEAREARENLVKYCDILLVMDQKIRRKKRIEAKYGK